MPGSGAGRREDLSDDGGPATARRSHGHSPAHAEPDLSSLFALAGQPDLDLRAVILRVHTDLFVTAPTRDPETIRAYEAMALGFLPMVDDDDAAILARKLAPLPDAPESVVLALVLRGGSSRDAIVARVPALTPSILQALKKAGVDLSRLIAARADLDQQAADQIVGRVDPELDLIVAQNHASALSGPLLDTLLARARKEGRLAVALLARPDLTAADVASLYLDADAARRIRIRHELEGLVGLRRPLSFRATAQACERLIEFAYQRDHAGFGATLAAVLGLPPNAAWRFTEERRHDLLALALTAAGVPEDDCLRIFLVLDDVIARSVPIVFELVDLIRATPRATAMHLVEAILGIEAAGRIRGRYIGATGPDSTLRKGNVAKPSSLRPPAQESGRLLG